MGQEGYEEPKKSKVRYSLGIEDGEIGDIG